MPSDARKRALSGPDLPLATTRRWLCPSCHRLFSTGHAIKTENGARFHNQEMCSIPMMRVRVVKEEV